MEYNNTGHPSRWSISNINWPKINRHAPDFDWCTRVDIVYHIGVGDIFVIAGQSNAVGYAREAVMDCPELGVHILRNSGKWDLATHPLGDSTNTIHEVNRDNANTHHSPYLIFAKYLKGSLGYPIGLIQTALGGACLSRWSENGDLYDNMIDILKGQNNKIKAILWYQGCSDTDEAQCDSYLDRFNGMVNVARKELENSALPFITVQLNRNIDINSADRDTGWSVIRDAQRLAAEKIDNVFVVPAIDLTLSDQIHISSSGNMTLGERLAKSALFNIYGKGMEYNPPTVEKITYKNGAINIKLKNVSDTLNMYYGDITILPFEVNDQNGVVEYHSYEMINEAIILKLKRNVVGECRVSAAGGVNPKGRMPIDSITRLPMLTFNDVLVEI